MASVEYKDEVWVFYYESGGDLYVLRGGEGNKYTYAPVLDGNNQRIKTDLVAHPLAVVSIQDGVSFSTTTSSLAEDSKLPSLVWGFLGPNQPKHSFSIAY